MRSARPHPGPRRFTTGSIILTGLAAMVAAILADVVIYLVADALGAIPENLPGSAEQFGIPAIVLACVLTIGVATVAFWLFTRFSQDPVRNVVILSGIVGATSLTGPFSIEGAGAGLVVTLLLMHVVTAAIVVALFMRLDRR